MGRSDEPIAGSRVKPGESLGAAMTVLRIAAAQSVSAAGDVDINIARHLRMMAVAAEHGVQLLVFPELSLSGYEIGLARNLAVHADDALFAPLRAQAQRCGMTVVVGAPILAEQGGAMFIAALALQPDGAMQVYRKRYLHAGEQDIFQAGTEDLTVAAAGTRVALAICADIVQPQHAARAARSLAQVYAAGVLIGASAYAAEAGMLRHYARDHQMIVLMANHGGPTGGWLPAGRSAIWAAGAAWSLAAPGAGNLLLLATREAGQWSGAVVDVPL